MTPDTVLSAGDAERGTDPDVDKVVDREPRVGNGDCEEEGDSSGGGPRSSRDGGTGNAGDAGRE